MIGYTASETALKNALLVTFSDKIDENNCKIGDIDGVITNMLREPRKYGLLLEFVGGQRRKPEGFNTYIWQWNILITFLVKLDTTTIEDDVRDLIDTLSTFCETNRTLSGQVAKFDLSFIDRPTAGMVGDIPITWMNITTYIWDK